VLLAAAHRRQDRHLPGGGGSERLERAEERNAPLSFASGLY